MKGNILLIAIIAALTLTCCNDASKHEKSGLTTVSTISPEAKAKYFPEETNVVEANEDNFVEFFVTSLKGNGANVRKHPNLDAKIIKVYPDGTYFYGVYTDKPHWIRIISNRKVVGYIHDENVTPAYTAGYYEDIDDYSTKEKQVINDYNNHDNERPKEAIKPASEVKNSDSETFRHKKHYHFSGYMTDNEGDHPIELDFDASNNGLSNIVYKNVTLGGKIHMKCTEFSGIQHLPNEDGGYSDYLDSFTIVGKDGPKDFIMSMTRVGNSPYEGTASVGSKKLTVMLYLE